MTDLERDFTELIGAVGLYLGELKSHHEGDKERLSRALKTALKNKHMREFHLLEGRERCLKI